MAPLINLVSIIITCYNQKKYISKAIQSVIDQTYSNWECIIVDDGSTDNSSKIIERFSEKDVRIQLIKQDNRGVSEARNCGFKKAKGTYIQFLDGDDWIEKTKIEKQVNFLVSNIEFDACYTKHNYFLAKENAYKNFDFETLSKKPFEQFLYKWHDTVAVPTHAFLYKRLIWSGNNLPYPIDYKLREEDWIFHVKTSMKNISYGFINEILCTYYIGDNNFTSSILNSCSNTIDAGLYIKKILPTEEQNKFWNFLKEKTLNRYHNAKKNEVLQASKNWQIGNAISKPFFTIIKLSKHLLKLKKND